MTYPRYQVTGDPGHDPWQLYIQRVMYCSMLGASEEEVDARLGSSRVPRPRDVAAMRLRVSWKWRKVLARLNALKLRLDAMEPDRNAGNGFRYIGITCEGPNPPEPRRLSHGLRRVPL